MPEKVYTFYQPVSRISQQGELIALWKVSWKRWGWEPTVLSMLQAVRHEGWKDFLAAIKRLPTVNIGVPGYETACYARHFAMAHIPEGGLLTDYDVMNYGVKWADVPPTPDELSLFERYRVPCMCLGTQAAYAKFVDVIMNYQPTREDAVGSRPHVSDMFIAQRTKLPVLEEPKCVEYTHDGWKGASLVHWATGAVRRMHGKGSKYRIIRGLRCPVEG
jgi:hypothetical protein